MNGWMDRYLNHVRIFFSTASMNAFKRAELLLYFNPITKALVFTP